jgi:GAF domain-containing protein
MAHQEQAVDEQPAVLLLRLLAQGAPAHQIATAAASPELRELALQIHLAFDVHRRRERELEALVETARDLASMRDPAGVLDAIVRRTRALLGTDVSYLTLFDPEAGDTYMRATAGSISARFQAVRLPLGAGLGGLVASTRRPYWTPVYATDERFRHTPAIDAAVADEGIVAICGTPLLVGDEFVGVLFTADRTERIFRADEVGLLTSLAALAAVSIVQVRALQDAEAALQALSEAHETVRRHTAGVERSAAAHDRFAEVLLAGGGIDDVTRALGELMGSWVLLVGEDGQERSTFGSPALTPEQREEGSRSAAAERSGRLVRLAGFQVVAVRAGRDVMGTLFVGGRRGAPLDDPDVRTIERAAVVCALFLLFERDVAESRRQVLADLVSDLIAGRGERDDRLRAARALGLTLENPFCVAVLRGPANTPRRAMTLSAQAVLGGKALVGVHDGDVVALVPGDDPTRLAQSLHSRMSRSGPVTVAVSNPASDVEAVGAAHLEACRTLAALLALGHEGTAAAAADLGFAGLIVGTNPDVTAYVQRVLGPVLDYDQARGTDLLGTLEAYFSSGGSPSRAAGVLHVHPNTVAQRLERIGRLLRDRWQDPGPALELQLALRMRRLVASLPEGPARPA